MNWACAAKWARKPSPTALHSLPGPIPRASEIHVGAFAQRLTSPLQEAGAQTLTAKGTSAPTHAFRGEEVMVWTGNMAAKGIRVPSHAFRGKETGVWAGNLGGERHLTGLP